MGAPLCGAHHFRDLAELPQSCIWQRRWIVMEPGQLPALPDLCQSDPAPFEVLVEIQVPILPAHHPSLLHFPRALTVLVVCFLPRFQGVVEIAVVLVKGK
jgi:hypothetical protein